MHYQHLKLLNVKGILKEGTLLNLGKVNVICGKNNSGKSTILQAINSTDRIVGKNLKLGEISPLNNFPTVWFPRGHGSKNSVDTDDDLEIKSNVKNFRKKYFKALDKLISDHEVWFSNESQEFSTELEGVAAKIFRTNIFENVDVESRRLFDYELADHAKPMLIPPKRRLKSTGQYSGAVNRLVGPDGHNFLSVVYWLKNLERNSSGNLFFHDLCEAFEKVSSGNSFNITRADNDELVLRFSTPNQNEIPADDCGLGLQDLLLILFFALDAEHEILLIEEPENHIHPEMQRKLLRFLAEDTDKQYFITTHSNIFLNNTYVDRVFFTEFLEGEIRLTDATSRARTLHDLGYAVTDNLVSDLIILVEGSGDKAFVEEFLSKLELDAKYNIKIWILGGNEMVNQDLSAFRQDYKIMALVDKDPESAKARDEFERNCKKFDIEFTKLQRYSIESYFPKRVLEEKFNKFNKNLPEVAGLTDRSFSNLVKSGPLWDNLGRTPQRKKFLKNKFKSSIRDIAKEMTIDDIENTDLSEFFDKVTKTLQDL